MATAFSALERLALFSLSAAIGLVDLAVALFVAVYLGVIPRNKVEQFRATIAGAPVIGRLFTKDVPAPRKAAVKKKTPAATRPQ